MAEMTLVDTQPRETAVVRGRVTRRDLPDFLGKAFAAVGDAVERQDTHVTGPPLAVYRLPGADGFDVEAGFPVAAAIVADGPVVPGMLPGGRTVEAVHVGPYETLPAAYAAMAAWIRGHGLRSSPGRWEVYLTDPDQAPPSTLLVQPV